MDYDKKAVSPQPKCLPNPAVDHFMYGPFEYLKLATYNVIPFVIIAALNVAIIVKLRRKSVSSAQVQEARCRSRIVPGRNDGDGALAGTTFCCCFCCFCAKKTTGSSVADDDGENSRRGQRDVTNGITQSLPGENANEISWLGAPDVGCNSSTIGR